MKNRPTTFVIVTALLCGLVVACGELVSDPNFHTWCGDQLCAWKLESGKIQRAPTWHPDDFGVELLDSADATHETRISQHIEASPKCLEFSTVADVATEAQVSVGVDFDDDGTVDYESPIAAVGFTEQKTQITAPSSYANFKLFIVKRGTGRAVLAQLNVVEATDCTAAPVKLTKQAEGTGCASLGGGAECKSGICCEGICAECCTGGSPVSVGVIDPDAGDGGGSNGAALGRLQFDTCPADQVCGKIALNAISFSETPHGIPMQCDVGKLKRAPGAECLINGDCTSGRCIGGVWNIDNIAARGAPCPAPPASSPDCNVNSVRAGTCE